MINIILSIIGTILTIFGGSLFFVNKSLIDQPSGLKVLSFFCGIILLFLSFAL